MHRDPSSVPSLFFQGCRLEAEVLCHAQLFRDSQSAVVYATEWLQQLQRSWGFQLPHSSEQIPSQQSAYQVATQSAGSLKCLIMREPGYPDPLLFWSLRVVLPKVFDHALRRRHALQIARLLYRQFSRRPDLW